MLGSQIVYLFVWKTIVCILIYEADVALLWIRITIQVGPVDIFKFSINLSILAELLSRTKTASLQDFTGSLSEFGEIEKTER